MINDDSVTLINKPCNFKFVTIGKGLVVQQAYALCRLTGLKTGKGIIIIKPHHLAYNQSKHEASSLNFSAPNLYIAESKCPV